jgi:CubicO group peptidase (beta-lactamase class C family)
LKFVTQQGTTVQRGTMVSNQASRRRTEDVAGVAILTGLVGRFAMRLRAQMPGWLACIALAAGGASGSARAADLSPALDPAAVHAFLAEVVPAEMQSARIEGVAVVVVEAGRMVAAEGYGKARPGAAGDIDALHTVFRAASMSKPVTAALVMQLVEEGTVDLDRDVSEYVGFTVPTRDGRAVTLREILTHTSGFSDTYRLLFAVNPRDSQPLSDFVRHRLPPLLYTPGTQPAYSNYAFSLAGYAVERLRGKPYATVARERIFEPLGMATATFLQPPEPAIAAALAQGYRRGGSQPGPFEYVAAVSAGALSVSAADYARFARALIEGGSLDGHAILRPATVAQMLTLHPGPEGAGRAELGMGLGVTVDRTRRGVTAIGHSGDTVQWHSVFRAYPERDLVIVAMQNTEGGPVVRTIVRRFEERFGLTPPLLTPVPETAEDQQVAGDYGPARYSAHSFLRIGRLFQVMPVVALPGGGIRVGSAPEPLVRVGPALYQDRTRTDRRALFLRDASGRVSGVRVEPYQTMTRVAAWERPALVFGLLGAGAAIALVTLLGCAGRFLWAKLKARPALPWCWGLAALSALNLLLCEGGFLTTATGMREDLYSMAPARDLSIRAFETAGFLSLAALIGFLVAARARWGAAARPERLGILIFAVGMLAVLGVLLQYRVLTSSLNY